MEERRKASLSSDQNRMETSTFKIPKKKGDARLVQQSSPLSRLSASYSNNSFKNRDYVSSSSDRYNRTRNQECCTYNIRSKRDIHKSSVIEEKAQAWSVYSQKISVVSPKKQIECPQDKGKKCSHDIFLTKKKEPKGNEETDSHQKGNKDLICTVPDSEKDRCLNSWSRKRRSSGSSSDQSSTSSQEKSTQQLKESKTNCLSPINKSQRRNHHCLRKERQTSKGQENVTLPQQEDSKLTCHGDNMELSVTCARKPSLDSFSKAPTCKSSSTRDNSLKIGGKRQSLRKSHYSKCSTSVADTIILSSDEEGESPESPSAAIVRLETLQREIPDSEDTAMTAIPPTSEQSPASIQEGETGHTMILDEPFVSSSHKTTTSRTEGRMPKNSLVEVQFLTIYIGKMKGRSQGTVKFTTERIEIPFQVNDSDKICLFLDTCHLKGYGLWTDDCDSPSGKRNGFIFLRLAEDYAENIRTQLGNPDSSWPSTVYELILLELGTVLPTPELLKFTELMRAVSKRNRAPKLCDSLSWEQVYPLFLGISPENWSFLTKLHTLSQEQQQQQQQSICQKLNAKHPKPNYTLVHKHSVDHYSVTISSKLDEEWSEVRSTGKAQKLIVYPPPPTKGGLGVTIEDLDCLEPGEFLNDVIIDFYLKYLLLEKIPKHLAERSHIFSSFFYKCLTRKENNSIEEISGPLAAEKRHQRVKTWTRHVDIFKKDYIFVPVNEESHWYLAVICFPSLEKPVYEDRQNEPPSEPQSRLQSKEMRNSARKDTVIVFHGTSNRKDEKPNEDSSQKSEGYKQHTSLFSTNCENPKNPLGNNSRKMKVCKRPCILMLDSLRAGSLQNTVQMLREYLQVEWHVKKGMPREFSRSNMRDFYPRVPKQGNSSDCGIYLLQYVESFFQNPIIDFELPISLERWFPPDIMRTKRREIHDLILKLHIQQQRSSTS
ncbi:sentrin-specific protease 7 [Microcaecilia unicolor]|uniref:Sentrin-specific protease 7 n=1 Tax=Microcaecilia unicolor TaxID=1415580 RepID=A0A6P7XX47_9AMPH|nr:sentrin-specific protease 7 [Microcaecilia unicolor]